MLIINNPKAPCIFFSPHSLYSKWKQGSFILHSTYQYPGHSRLGNVDHIVSIVLVEEHI